MLASLDKDKSKLVIDLSCRKHGDSWIVAMNKWQTPTDMEVTEGRFLSITGGAFQAHMPFLPGSIKFLEPFCSEFLIHAADNEGLQRGIDERLVERLGQWCTIPVTYAGGGKSIDDLDKVRELSRGRVDLTIGSALDIFGGKGVLFEDCVAWNSKQADSSMLDKNSKIPFYE